MNRVSRVLGVLGGLFATVSVAWAQNRDRLGFSPEDRQRFDRAVAEGDFYFYLGIGAIVVGVLCSLAGLAYHLMKKRKA